MPPKFAVGDRVRCLATRFDAGSADRNGDVFSVRQRALGFGEYCFGSVKWVYSSRKGEQSYRVLYDGDSTQMQSTESHLEPEGCDADAEYDGDSMQMQSTESNMSELGGNSVTIIFVVRVLHVWHAYFFILTFWFIPVVHQDIINDTVEEADVLIAEGDEAVSEYEKIRLSNIKRNSEFLLSLGLGEVGIRRGARVQQKRQKREEKREPVKQLHSQVHMDKEEEADTIEQLHSQAQKYKVEINQLHSQLNSFTQANFFLHSPSR